jgi:hypothetical protein
MSVAEGGDNVAKTSVTVYDVCGVEYCTESKSESTKLLLYSSVLSLEIF